MIRTNPTRPDAYLVLGTLANRAKKLDVARGYLMRALEIQPNLAEASHQLALNHGYRREWREASEQMSLALQMQPRNPVYRYNAGALFYNAGAYPAALQEFRQAMKLHPGRFEPQFAVASTLEAEKKIPEALAEFNAIIRKHPREARAHYARAAILMELGRIEEALKDAEKAISLKGYYADTFYLLGKIYEQKQQFGEALRAYQTVTELEKGHLNARYRLSVVYARLGRQEEARRESDAYRSLKASVDCANALIFGTDYLKSGDLRNAETQFAKALENEPKNTQALYYLAVVQQRQKETAKAVESFQKLLALDPNLAIAHANLGVLLAGTVRIEARAHLQRAGELDQNEFGVSYTAGRGFLLLEDYAAAEKSLLRALELWPAHPRVFVDLFQLYALWGKNQQAARYAQLALETNPGDSDLRRMVDLFRAQK